MLGASSKIRLGRSCRPSFVRRPIPPRIPPPLHCDVERSVGRSGASQRQDKAEEGVSRANEGRNEEMNRKEGKGKERKRRIFASFAACGGRKRDLNSRRKGKRRTYAAHLGEGQEGGRIYFHFSPKKNLWEAQQPCNSRRP